jgi:NAD(P)-dependent dehydrogenase (short-subunit alcohol dehydrogenase family)
VLVIGASGGVGGTLTRHLMARGYNVLGSVLDQADLERSRAAGLADADLFIANFSDAEVGKAQIREALDRVGQPIKAVVHCIGINPCGPLETDPIDVFRRTMEINVVSALAVYQATLPHLRQSQGRYVFIGSLLGKVAMPLCGHYNISKYALEGLVDTMRLEAGQWGVHVSLLEPGRISTAMSDTFVELLDICLAGLDKEGRANYGDYIAQHKALSGATASGAGALDPDVVAKTIISAIEAETPETRYPVGDAVELLDTRKRSSDIEMDALVNGFLPGRRVTA